MADLAKTIAIIFQGDDQVTKTISSVTSGLDSFAGGVEDLTEPFANLTKSLLAVEAAAVAMVAGGFAYAINKAGEFGDSFNEISTLVDTSSENLDKFRNDILEYSKDSVKSIDEINGAVYAAISAGVAYSDSLDLINVSEKLSVAGKADLDSTTKVLVSTLNAYGASTDQASKYSDVLFQVVKKGQTTLPELSSSLAKVTGIAAAGNVPIETLGAAIAALTASGVNTSEAMTSIKAALSNIIKPSSEAAKLAKELGIEFNASALESRGFENVLKEVYTATGGNVEQMAKLFGSTEALNSVLVLSRDSTGKFAEALKEMRDAAGSTDEAYKKMAENFGAINQNLANNLQAVFIQIGAPLLEQYGSVAEAVINIFKGVSTSIDAGAFTEVFNAIDNFGAELSKKLNIIAKNIPEALAAVDYKGLISSFDDLGKSISDALEAFFGDMNLSSVEGLRTVIQKIIDSFTGLTNVVSGIVGGLTPFIEKAGDLATEFANTDSESQKLAGNFLGLATGINEVFGYVGQATSALSVLSGAMTTMAAVDVVKLVTSINGLSSAMSATFGVVQSLAGKAGLVGLAGAAGYAAGSLLTMVPGVNEAAQSFAKWTDEIFNWTGTQGQVEDTTSNVNAQLNLLQKQLEASSRGFTDGAAATGTFADALSYVQSVPTIDLTVNTDQASIDDTRQQLEDITSDEIVLIQPLTDPSMLRDTKNQIDEAIPPIKRLEIETDLQIAQIQAQADVMQSAFDFKAKVDVAEIEAGARRIEALSDGISSTMQSSADVLSSAFGALGDATGLKYYALLDMAKKEQELREKAFELQKDLTEAEIELIKAKKEQIKKGTALIKVEAAGLTPALEMIWQEVVAYSQVRASEEGLSLLL